MMDVVAPQSDHSKHHALTWRARGGAVVETCGQGVRGEARARLQQLPADWLQTKGLMSAGSWSFHEPARELSSTCRRFTPSSAESGWLHRGAQLASAQSFEG